MTDLQKQWYVVQTLTGQEQKAQRQIVAQARATIGMCDYFDIPAELVKGENLNDYNVVVPTEKVVEIKEGKKRVITRKICPGYVLIHMSLYEDAALRSIRHDLWRFIQSIPGVIGFLGGSSTKPRPISEQEADNLLRRVEAESEKKPKLKVKYDIGETIRITEGPFMNFNGTIQQIDPDSGRLQISVPIFGRSAPVTAEYWQVERVTDHPEGV